MSGSDSTAGIPTSDGGRFEPGDGPHVTLLTAHTRHEIDTWIARFPAGRQRSAQSRRCASRRQQNQGYLTAELMDGVAEYLRMPPIQVYEVASFYSMFETHPVGRHTSASAPTSAAGSMAASRSSNMRRRCSGSRSARARPTCRIFLKQEEECLAACTGAPMMMVDHVFHENLTPESVDRILDDLE